MNKVRKIYSELINTYLHYGQSDLASDCITKAIENGVWLNELQRPSLEFDPTLFALPFHNPEDFSFTSYLENNFSTIYNEYSTLNVLVDTNFFPVEQNILKNGKWNQIIFYDEGIRSDNSFALLPKMGEVIDGLRNIIELPGIVSLICLHPKSVVIPHCGHTNTRLRVHLGIEIPDKTGMRVANKTSFWEVGKCIVFDDSFEHYVWNNSNQPRIILMFDIFHPDLSQEKQHKEVHKGISLENKIKDFMETSSLIKIKNNNGDLSLRLKPDVDKVIKRMMKNNSINSVEYKNGELLLTYHS